MPVSASNNCDRCQGCNDDRCLNPRNCGDTNLFNSLTKEELRAFIKKI